MTMQAEREQEMEQYDPDTDPREIGQDVPAFPLVTGEAPWLLQVSFKTPSGTLINVRGMEGIDVAAGLAALQGIADQIKHTEDLFGGQHALQVGLGARPVAPQPTPQPQFQQPNIPGGTQNPPLCAHGQPAKFVAGGISKKTGRAYRAFWACAQPQGMQCDWRQDG